MSTEGSLRRSEPGSTRTSVWQVARGDYSWMNPDLTVLYRDYGPEDRSPSSTGTASAGPSWSRPPRRRPRPPSCSTPPAGRPSWRASWAGQVSAPDAPEAVARLAADPLLVGLRPMVQDIPDDDWLVRQTSRRPSGRSCGTGSSSTRSCIPTCRASSSSSTAIPTCPSWSITGRSPRSAFARLDPWRADMAAVAARPARCASCRGSSPRPPGLERREPAALRRPPPRGVRPGAPPVGQRLAGRNLAGGYDRWRGQRWHSLAGLPGGPRRDPRRQRGAGLPHDAGAPGRGLTVPPFTNRAAPGCVRGAGRGWWPRNPAEPSCTSGIGITLDRRFARLVNSMPGSSASTRGCRWAEGPAYFPAGRYLVWSIPNDRMLRYDETSGASASSPPAGYSNGNTVDREGRLVTCEHGNRRVSRTERRQHHGDRRPLRGQAPNSPNDVVVASDGAVWFTDPAYGIDSDFEATGRRARSAPATSTGSIPGPAPCGSRPTTSCARTGSRSRPTSAASTSPTPAPAMPRTGRATSGLRCRPRGRLSGGEVFATCTSGAFDGFRLDEAGRIWTSAGDGVHCYDPDGT